MSTIIKTEDLQFTYPANEDREPIYALKGVGVSVRKGSFTVVLGHNGSGKSTLAKTFNAVLLPSVVATNAHVATAKYAQLARACGMGSTADTVAVRNLRNNLIRLRRELKLPETLAQAGIAPGALRSAMNDVVSATLSDPCCKTNPMKVEDFLVRRILEEVTGRV